MRQWVSHSRMKDQLSSHSERQSTSTSLIEIGFRNRSKWLTITMQKWEQLRSSQRRAARAKLYLKTHWLSQMSSTHTMLICLRSKKRLMSWCNSFKVALEHSMVLSQLWQRSSTKNFKMWYIRVSIKAVISLSREYHPKIMAMLFQMKLKAKVVKVKAQLDSQWQQWVLKVFLPKIQRLKL